VASEEVKIKIPFFERRRRVSLPWTLLIFGVIFLILPFMNYWAMAQRFQIPLRYPGIVLRHINIFELILLLLPFLVGAGLILVKRWAWYLFLGYSAALMAYNTVILILSRRFYNASALVQTALFVAAAFYFLRKDISAPYMKMYPRGWRLQKRKPVIVDVIVDGIRRRTTDVSDSGFYVEWEDCYRSPGEEVHVTFRLGENDYSSRAGIVRVDEDGAGVAFRATDSSFRRRLMKDLASSMKKVSG